MVSLTTRNQKTCSLLDLQKTETEATLYTAFFEPKNQVDAIKLIYGVESTSNINWAPSTKARVRLLEKGMIEDLNPEKKRNAFFKSSVSPIINTVKIRDAERGSSLESNSEYYSALEQIIDSDWFRGFYSSEILRGQWEGSHFYHVYFQNLIKIKVGISHYHLRVADPVNLFTNLMSDIAALSWELTALLQKRGSKIPTIEQVVIAESFDSLIQSHVYNFPKDLIDVFFDSLTLPENPDPSIFQRNYNKRLDSGDFPFLPKTISNHMKKASMFIPSEVSARMRYSGKFPVTVANELPDIILRIEKKYSLN